MVNFPENQDDLEKEVVVSPLMGFAEQIAEATQNTDPDAPQQIVQKLKSENPNTPDEQIVQKVQNALGSNNDPAKQSLYNSIAPYSPEARAAKQQEYETKAANIDTSKNMAGLAARSLEGLDKIEGRYDRKKAETKENIIGSFDKEAKLAFDQLTMNMDIETKKIAIEKGNLEIAQFRTDKANIAQLNDPKSNVSKLRQAQFAALAPDIAKQLGDNLKNASAAQIEKMIPTLERMDKRVESQIALAQTKQIADQNSADRRYQTDTAAQTSRQNAGMMAAAAGDRVSDKKDRDKDKKYQDDERRQDKKNTEASRLEDKSLSIDNNLLAMKNVIKDAKEMEELNKKGIGGSSVSERVRNAGAFFGLPGTEATNRWNSLQSNVQLDKGQKLKGNPTSNEQNILKSAGGLGLNVDEGARAIALKNIITNAEAQAKIYERVKANHQKEIDKLRGNETAPVVPTEPDVDKKYNKFGKDW